MRGVNSWDKRVCALSAGLITLGGGANNDDGTQTCIQESTAYDGKQ